ncbi:MAG: acylphosphatase [Chloroflexota bacterium]|jgi:acylphosphatase|nr:acylphosphatase [Chloroflexota bacterium]
MNLRETKTGVTMTGDGDRVSVVLRIRGHVQGVGFRVNARREAARLGVDAKLENLPDGSVRVRVSGNAGAVAAFRRWCEGGPELAQVDSVEEDAAGTDEG